MNQPSVVLFDIPETLCFPALKKPMMSIINIGGPVASIAIPGREFYLEINGFDTQARSESGVLFFRHVRQGMSDTALGPMDARMRHLGYSDADIGELIILNMLNHVRVIFTGGPKDCAPCLMVVQKKLAFFDRPYVRLVPSMDGAIAKATFNFECKAPIKVTYNETRVWEDGVKRNQMSLIP